MRRFLLNVMFIITLLMTNAQTLNVTGIVVYDSEPLTGTSVRVKGSPDSIVVDASGNFSLRATKGDKLVFRYLTYTKEVKVKDEKPLYVVMDSSFPNITLSDDDAIMYLFKPTKAVYVEAFGASTMVGVNYDSRFKGNKGWGYRVGLSYAYGEQSFFISDTIKGVAVPLEINYLLGNRKSKFELGAGVSLGYYKQSYDYIEFFSDGEQFTPTVRYETLKSFGYFVFFNIGYRFQPVKGFDFRVGITPSFNFGDKRGITRSGGLPYISFGYAFH